MFRRAACELGREGERRVGLFSLDGIFRDGKGGTRNPMVDLARNKRLDVEGVVVAIGVSFNVDGYSSDGVVRWCLCRTYVLSTSNLVFLTA